MATPEPVALRRIEFVGMPSPYSDPEIQYRMAMGTLSKRDRLELRRRETERQRHGMARYYGVTVRILGREAVLERGGGFAQPQPNEKPLLDAHGQLLGRTVAPGWHHTMQRTGRQEDLTPEQILTFRGKTYVAEPGWDRVYIFGPRDFTQLMTAGDVERLFASKANRLLFRDLEHPIYLDGRPADVVTIRAVPVKATALGGRLRAVS